jgi:hypothetical protein
MIAAAREQASTDVIVPAAVPAFAVIGLCAASGGNDRTAWDLATIGFVAVTAVVLWRRRPAIAMPARWCITGFAGLALWSASSHVWSSDPPATTIEVQRWLMITSALACFVAVSSVWGGRAVVAGVATGATTICAYAVLMRLLPSLPGSPGTPGVNRLDQPVGYWNALGSLAMIGLILVAGLAVGGARHLRLACALAAAPLGLGLYLTFSRGALLALVAGLVLAVSVVRTCAGSLLDASVLVPSAVVPVVIVQAFPALTSAYPRHAAQVRQGGAALILILASMAICGWAAMRWRRILYRAAEAAARRRWIVLGGAALLGVMAVVVVGGIVHVLETSGQSSPHFQGGDLNRRLLSLSDNGRGAIWRLAWDDVREHPLIGSGDGTFAQLWAADPGRPFPVQAAHSLYLETAAELGLVGLTLLLVVLVVPFRAIGVPTSPVVAAAAGASAGYLLQAAFDWTWDVSGVTVAVLACLAVLTTARPPVESPGRPGEGSRPDPRVAGTT